jgi:formylglycine-generating enzyme required for sulfatase activity
LVSADTLTNSIGMKLKLIPAGEFLMGSPDSDSEAVADEKPQHRVTITKPFYLGVYEVTQAEYQRVMGTNPSAYSTAKVGQDTSQHPVDQVSWEDTVEFCRQLSELPDEKAAGRLYRLPTAAEWEYACRAGSATKYSFGDSESQLGDYAWYDDSNSESSAHPVGQKKPNAFGLYDMHGNVWEWCQDWYAPYAGEASDPQGPASGSRRVYRGGCWFSTARNCRSAYRFRLSPAYRNLNLGFRLALVPSSSSQEN